MIKDATRQFVWQRAGETCEYCQFPHGVNELQFEVDHVVALKHGGDSSTDNLCKHVFTAIPTRGQTSRELIQPAAKLFLSSIPGGNNGIAISIGKPHCSLVRPGQDEQRSTS